MKEQHNKMSLFENVLDEAGDLCDEYAKAVEVWDWVRSKIDFPKFRRRAVYSRTDGNESVTTKVVLMEYPSTCRNGDTLTYHYVPGTNINTNCLQYDKRVLDYLHYQISDRDPNVIVYTRRKIIDGREPHGFLRQLVVKFKARQQPPPSPIVAETSPPGDVPLPDESLDEDVEKGRMYE